MIFLLLREKSALGRVEKLHLRTTAAIFPSVCVNEPLT